MTTLPLPLPPTKKPNKNPNHPTPPASITTPSHASPDVSFTGDDDDSHTTLGQNVHSDVPDSQDTFIPESQDLFNSDADDVIMDDTISDLKTALTTLPTLTTLKPLVFPISLALYLKILQPQHLFPFQEPSDYSKPFPLKTKKSSHVYTHESLPIFGKRLLPRHQRVLVFLCSFRSWWRGNSNQNLQPPAVFSLSDIIRCPFAPSCQWSVRPTDIDNHEFYSYQVNYVKNVPSRLRTHLSGPSPYALSSF